MNYGLYLEGQMLYIIINLDRVLALIWRHNMEDRNPATSFNIDVSNLWAIGVASICRPKKKRRSDIAQWSYEITV